MSHGLFYRYIYYVSGPGNISVVLLSMEGQRALGFHQNILICVLKMNEGLTGLERHEGKYNPKSEKVGTVWKTQIKKESSDF